MNEFLIEAKGITKTYGRNRALDDFSVSLRKNTIYGLLGRNGAGKTTLLNILTSRIFPDAGSVSAFGEKVTDNAHILPRICYMPEKNMFMRNMTVKNTLRFAGEFFADFDPDYAERLCKVFELDTRKRYKALSRGYESVLRIVIGLASRAELTIFDEPVLGLDAAVRDVFYRELIDDYSEHPRTFVISTHLIEESADLFEEAVIIKSGKLIEQCGVEDLKSRAHYISGRSDQVKAAVTGMNVLHTERMANMRMAAVYQPLGDDERKRLEAAGVEVTPMPVQKLFIYLTNPDERSSSDEEAY